MGPCIVEIDCIVIRECRNEEVIVNGNFMWVWPMWAGRPRMDPIVIREVQYQLEVNRYRNEEIIVKGNFGWVWSMWAGAPGLVMGPCIVEIDRIVIREVKYQFEVNQCRNEEIIVKRHFWVGVVYLAGRPRVGNGPMHNVQYQFEVNRCINEEFQGSMARTDGQTDRQRAEITTISPRFSKSVGIIKMY
ncbi:hypothetical protein DPMN_174841 [Dreissena polymorpha]|uniref:Uncharacterized protein n=1 Tax=Dreissena polymorpha TaxID=45954 RepID=A0A9D4IHI2_DREPO|nr:hypothetical protein DPMN_174841 [Dreissena polymorpha]